MNEPLILNPAETARKLKIGFIGGGINSAVGRAHFCATQLDGTYDLAAGCFSRNPKTNQDSAAYYGVAADRVYTHADELLAAEAQRLDALVILTPTSDHLQPLLAALKVGLPVICEKAMVADTKDAAIVSQAEQQSNGFLAMTYNYTGYPCVRELRQWIESGRLGRLRHLSADMPQEGFLRRDRHGNPMQPQAWRLRDGDIPTVYLDLGTHLHQIVHYLTRLQPLSVGAFHASYGHFPGVVDYVNASVEYPDGVHGSFTFGKSMLGQRNGLRIRLYGEQASAEWAQAAPEILKLCHNDGRIEIIDRGGDMNIASQIRYTRFKSGHPAGYIEAFANLYQDIGQCILDYRTQGDWRSDEVFGSVLAGQGLRFLQTMSDAAVSGQRLPLSLD
ncbi:gfo/Idh/MocA family oxidoreductase [Chromobacterium sp. Panama]|uniref:Gfo/Idh/MocA family protein n=1 Tax=Chromobacterium sp. Panama TaxID=2161826 RepID=UPI000D31424F|nr:Gfo/Idh/MocA family oxidoreductase [Chromobacterium sp. Panama]PTU67282.1 gfo/Idh/MocA family oxidoreductase [Chromobacterium sp. Panama]